MGYCLGWGSEELVPGRIGTGALRRSVVEVSGSAAAGRSSALGSGWEKLGKVGTRVRVRAWGWGGWGFGLGLELR